VFVPQYLLSLSSSYKNGSGHLDSTNAEPGCFTHIPSPTSKSVLPKPYDNNHHHRSPIHHCWLLLSAQILLAFFIHTKPILQSTEVLHPHENSTGQSPSGQSIANAIGPS